MEKISNNQLASLKISRDVIATVSRVAAYEIEGVVSLSERPGNLKGFFSKGLSRPIEINLTDDFAEIDICLCLEYGAIIPDVCTAVQANIKDNVQTMTGIVVSKVNVTVAEITFSKQREEQ